MRMASSTTMDPAEKNRDFWGCDLMFAHSGFCFWGPKRLAIATFRVVKLGSRTSKFAEGINLCEGQIGSPVAAENRTLVLRDMDMDENDSCMNMSISFQMTVAQKLACESQCVKWKMWTQSWHFRTLGIHEVEAMQRLRNLQTVAMSVGDVCRRSADLVMWWVNCESMWLNIVHRHHCPLRLPSGCFCRPRVEWRQLLDFHHGDQSCRSVERDA